MATPTPGPRDHLITRGLRRDLDELEPEAIASAPLDAAEAPERLARYLMHELRRDLESEGEVEAVVQANRVNELLRDFTEPNDAAELILPPQVLEGIKPRSSLGDLIELSQYASAIAPASSSLVGADHSPRSPWPSQSADISASLSGNRPVVRPPDRTEIKPTRPALHEPVLHFAPAPRASPQRWSRRQ